MNSSRARLKKFLYDRRCNNGYNVTDFRGGKYQIKKEDVDEFCKLSALASLQSKTSGGMAPTLNLITPHLVIDFDIHEKVESFPHVEKMVAIVSAVAGCFIVMIQMIYSSGIACC